VPEKILLYSIYTTGHSAHLNKYIKTSFLNTLETQMKIFWERVGKLEDWMGDASHPEDDYCNVCPIG
jgi:hypothetical protein